MPDKTDTRDTTSTEPIRAAFFDIDGTLTSERTWMGLIDYFQQHGLRRGTHLALLATHYPLYFFRRLGFISESAFRAPWAAHLSWYFRGYTLEESEAIWNWAVEKYLSRYWRMDSLSLMDKHRQAGDLVMLVSSAPLPMVQRIAIELGAGHSMGTRFEVRDGRYTGRSLEPVCIDIHKANLPREYLAKAGLNVDLGTSFAYADSVADLPLLEMVGNPVAVYADEHLRAIAKARGWQIFPA